jgi:hypothetical protein
MAVWQPPADDADSPVTIEDRAVKFTSLVCEHLRVAATQSITGQLLANADLDVVADVMAKRLTYHLTAYVLAERLGDHTETATTETPATPWDHWKACHPVWADRCSRLVWRLTPPRFVTRSLSVTWTDWATFPRSTLPIDLPAVGEQVSVRTRRRDDTGWST